MGASKAVGGKSVAADLLYDFVDQGLAQGFL